MLSNLDLCLSTCHKHDPTIASLINTARAKKKKKKHTISPVVCPRKLKILIACITQPLLIHINKLFIPNPEFLQRQFNNLLNTKRIKNYKKSEDGNLILMIKSIEDIPNHLKTNNRRSVRHQSIQYILIPAKPVSPVLALPTVLILPSHQKPHPQNHNFRAKKNETQ